MLVGPLGDMLLWGMPTGEWWEAGSGSWTEDRGAITGNLTDDPKGWAWITSPLSFPDSFELTCDLQGTAELAGFGFGPNKDFLAPVNGGVVHLQLNVARGEGRLLADGELVQPAERTQLHLVDKNSIRTGRLQLKAKLPIGSIRFSTLHLRRASDAWSPHLT